MNKQDTIAIKAFAILFVLLGHTNYLDSSGAWGVHIFLFLSGYGLEISYQKNGLTDFWRKRFRKVFIPYEAVVLVALPIEMLVNKQRGFLNVIVSMTGLDFGYNIDPSMWYISYCFLLYAEFYLWKRFEKKVTNVVQYMMLLAFIVFNFWLSIMDKFGFATVWSSAAQVWVYTIDFYVGIAFARKGNYSKKIQYISGFIALVYFVVRYGKIHYKVDLILFSLSAAFITLLLGMKLKIGKCKGIQKLGSISLWIYLLEGHLLRWKGYLFGSSNSNILNMLVILLSLLIGYIAYQMNSVLQNKVRLKNIA